MKIEYTPDRRPLVLINPLVMANRKDPRRWLREQFYRGQRVCIKFHDRTVRSDISAIWHGIDRYIRDIIVDVGHDYIAEGGTVEVFTVSKHGNPHNVADMRRPTDPLDLEMAVSFHQSAIQWVWEAGFSPRIWMGNGTRRPSPDSPYDHRPATIRTAIQAVKYGITIGSEAFGLKDGEWDHELLAVCPVMANTRFATKHDRKNKLVVPTDDNGNPIEIHHVLKHVPNDWDRKELEEYVDGLGQRGFIVSSGSQQHDWVLEDMT